MILCPNCNHQNPEGAVQCEACYTPLPALMACPRCGAGVQADASFCGQCGLNLKSVPASAPVAPPAVEVVMTPPVAPEAASLSPALTVDRGAAPPVPSVPSVTPAPTPPVDPVPVLEEVAVPSVGDGVASSGDPVAADVAESPAPAEEVVPPVPAAVPDSRTQLQQQTARLLHVQTNLAIELPQNLALVHLGKPNDRVPPDIDVSGFPHSEIVSRIHADIRIEGDSYYIEDVGSSNGTYINNMPLPMGNRHRLRTGDRIALGKGDKVTFLFQLS